MRLGNANIRSFEQEQTNGLKTGNDNAARTRGRILPSFVIIARSVAGWISPFEKTNPFSGGRYSKPLISLLIADPEVPRRVSKNGGQGRLRSGGIGAVVLQGLGMREFGVYFRGT
jgi:hypothetical protein